MSGDLTHHTLPTNRDNAEFIESSCELSFVPLDVLNVAERCGTLKDGETKYDVMLTADGKITLIDGKEAIAYYEVLIVTADKKTLEVEVSPEGKILKTEEKKEEKK